MYHQATVKINNNNNDNDDDDDDDDDDADNNNGSNRNVNRKKITHTFAHVLALSVSLVVEVTSIQLSSLALRMSRDSAYLRAGKINTIITFINTYNISKVVKYHHVVEIYWN